MCEAVIAEGTHTYFVDGLIGSSPLGACLAKANSN